MITTEDLSLAWSTQHQVYPGDSWARAMWDSWLDPQRIQLVKAIQRVVETPESILEVGCGSGPNLRLCHGQWPSADLSGVDINKEGMLWGTARAWSEGWDWIGEWYDLTNLKGIRSHDVVMTCYTLTYIAPAEINEVLRQLIPLAKKALIIMEPMVSQQEVMYAGQLAGQQGYPEYWYNYLSRFTEILKGGQWECRIEPMALHGHLNGIVTVLPTERSSQ